jgi:protein gp37
LKLCDRFKNNSNFPEIEQEAYAGGRPFLKCLELGAPARRLKPARIGVQFMGDLFHESIPDAWIARVFLEMEATPQHKFFVLTKRVERMQEWVRVDEGYHSRHIWAGVTIENQAAAEERVPLLWQIPSPTFLSIEPLLENIDLDANYLGGLDWVIVGSESGSKRRPCPSYRIDNIVQQCQVAGVPCFVKQAHDKQGKIIHSGDSGWNQSWPQEYPK